VAAPLLFATTETLAPVKLKTLSAMIESMDLLDSANSQRIVEAIDSTLIAIFGTESVAYKRLVESVEIALQGEE